MPLTLKVPLTLKLGSDLALRHRYFASASFAHPAKLHLGLYKWIFEDYTLPGETIADPMAGIGSCLLAATQQRNVIAREIESKWLALMAENTAHIIRHGGLFVGGINIGQADAREPWGYEANHIIFSPPYGCAFSKSRTAKGTLPQRLSRMPQKPEYQKRWQEVIASDAASSPGYMMMHYGEHPAQIGHFRKAAYWQAMREIYTQAHAALRGGYMVLVIKDHIRDGQRVPVSCDTVELCESLGFVLCERHVRLVHPLSLWQRRRKEQGHPVIETEDVLFFRKGVR